jgi:di/tricarboxylate transporter
VIQNLEDIMLKRIIDSWPYALALVIAFVVLGAAGSVTLAADPSQVMGVTVLYGYILQPLLLLVGAVVLGFRRGFDPVTLLTCLGVYILAFAALGLRSNDAGFFADNIGLAVGAFFLPAALVGTGIGVGLRALARRVRTSGAV